MQKQLFYSICWLSLLFITATFMSFGIAVFIAICVIVYVYLKLYKKL